MPGVEEQKTKETMGAPESVEELLRKNIALGEKIHEQNRRILRRMTLAAVASYIRLLILIVPLILAFIFLPPIIREYVESLNAVFGTSEDGGNANLLDLLSEMRK